MNNVDFMNLLAEDTSKDSDNYRNDKKVRINSSKYNNTSDNYWSRWQKELNRRVNDSSYEFEWQDTGWIYKN